MALVGERGREVRDFLEDALKQQRKHAVTVVATGDESPMMRRLAPKTAMCIAEYFRDHGDKVLLIVDSVTRFAHAARDVALAAGEPPVSRGYTPSVFSELPKFLERAGPGEEGAGSITGVFSVLVDGDDHNDPVADNIRGTLDGHIVLERAIADQGRFPAVNVLTSISRLAKSALHAGAVGSRHEAPRHDRPLRGHAGSAPDRRLSQRFGPRPRQGRPAGPEDLRRHAAESRTIPQASTSSRILRVRWQRSPQARCTLARCQDSYAGGSTRRLRQLRCPACLPARTPSLLT